MTIKSPETFQNTEAFEDEIDLRELFTVLWNGKLALSPSSRALPLFVRCVVRALALPNIYESKALLAPNDESGAGGLAGLARSSTAGSASLAGINIGGGGGGANLRSLIMAQQKIHLLRFFHPASVRNSRA